MRIFLTREFLKKILIVVLNFMESLLEIVLHLEVLNGLIVICKVLCFERKQLILIKTELMIFVFGLNLLLLEL